VPNYFQGSRGSAGARSERGPPRSRQRGCQRWEQQERPAGSPRPGHIVDEVVGDNIARGQRRKVDQVVRLHHAEGLSDPQAERTSHMPGYMAAQGPEVTHHRAPCLPGTLVYALARLESCLLQNL
jgi:hypothetical protein